MRASVTRSPVIAAIAAVVLLLIGVVAGGTAHADGKAKKDIQQKVKEAMENFDLLEYEEARKLLNQALTIAKKGNLEKDPVAAQVHVRLGIVYFAGLNDAESAKLSFLNAVEVDAKVQIDAAYRTPEMAKLLDEARTESVADRGSGGGPDPEPASDGAIDCATVSGIQHTLVDTAGANADLPIEAHLGSDLGASKVVVMFRPQGATDFTEAKLTKKGACGYAGAIPAKALGGELVHYYVAAYNKAGKVLASKGSAGSPNIIEISGGESIAPDCEDPLNPGAGCPGGGGSGGSRGGDVSGGVSVGSAKKTLFVAVSAGTGGGYVSGETESNLNKVECCFAPSMLHIFPEIGIFLTPQTTLSAAGRIGFPIGANIRGHAAVAPAGLVRIRHAFSPDGSGVMISGAIGGGTMRNVIKLTEAPEDMDTDIAAVGPLLVGAGAAYAADLGGPIKLVAELNALAGIPVVSEIGLSHLNFGVQLDFNLGLMFGF